MWFYPAGAFCLLSQVTGATAPLFHVVILPGYVGRPSVKQYTSGFCEPLAQTDSQQPPDEVGRRTRHAADKQHAQSAQDGVAAGEQT